MSAVNFSSDVFRVAQTIASDCIGARTRILNRAISRLYDEAIRPHGLKFSQMNILTVVTVHEPIQQIDVRRILSLEKSTLSRNVALMEAKGWIQSSPGEGKNRLLQATPLGHQLLVEAAPDWQRAQEQAVAILGKRTAAEIVQAAEAIGRSVAVD